jgi:threonylcarbamoyladenosine tRNA methylthiotransferase MtaB
MKVFLDMVGCRLNQSELEAYAHQFRLAGHTLTSDPGLADLIVINTCAVTSAAASDSRHKIRKAAGAGSSHIIVTGCYATLHQIEAAEFPGDIQVIDNQEKDHLVSTVLKIPLSELSQKKIQRVPIPGTRSRTRMFLKVQDGCDNHCTYCITRIARGPGRSRKVDTILEDIHSALDGGTQEIVLTGVHLGSWGNDFDTPSHLSNLVNTILSETSTPRLRLSSLEPWDITPGFFDLWQSQRLCRHLHLPLQSGCEATLHRMGRRINPKTYADVIKQARSSIPDVAITTDIITGFPGETEEEFAESVTFVDEIAFAGGHVFTYSARPGTVAALLPGQVPHSLSKKRSARMCEFIQQSSTTYQASHLGQHLQVLWEKSTPIEKNKWELSGLTDNNLRVYASSRIPYHNQLMNVRISGFHSVGLLGEIQSTNIGNSHSQDTL